jgi:hypothetical protein
LHEEAMTSTDSLEENCCIRRHCRLVGIAAHRLTRLLACCASLRTPSVACSSLPAASSATRCSLQRYSTARSAPPNIALRGPPLRTRITAVLRYSLRKPGFRDRRITQPPRTRAPLSRTAFAPCPAPSTSGSRDSKAGQA